MIGTVLFYVLRPLSWYLTSLFTEASTTKHPPELVNGTAVCDGGALSTLTFTQSQATLSNQQISPGGGAKEKKKESAPEKEDGERPNADKEQLITVLLDEAVSKGSDEPAAAKDKEVEIRNRHQQDNLEDPKHDDGEIGCRTLSNMNHNKKDECIPLKGDINPEQVPGPQLKFLLMEDKTGESTCTVQKTITNTSLGETMQEQVHRPHVEKSTLAKPTVEETVCWDEYMSPVANEIPEGERSEQIFASLLSDVQTHLMLSSQHDTQMTWHFPAGPGLSEEVQCPLWPLPAMSYYPVSEPTVPFEVMWRLWEETEEMAPAAESALIPFPFTKASMDFTVMSYNILADDLLMANMELYTHCPLEVLDWGYRSTLVLEEILKWSPDIVCLQEVQENHYHTHLYPALSQRGYTCVYKQRTGNKTDGCATCYRRSCFSEMSVTFLEYFRPETRLLDRHNIGIVSLLRPIGTCGSKVEVMGPPLCVANTHLLFNPRRGDVKLAQLAIMLAEIDKVVKSCEANGEFCNVILCGDFNSVPHSPLYKLISTGELFFQDLPAWTISGQEDLSHRAHCYRLCAPLWPSCLGISHHCQYTTVNKAFRSHSETPGKRQYSHDFLLQLRFSPAACVRPLELELIPGVTDNTPDAERDYQRQHYDESFSHSLHHGLNLESVYQHVLPGSGSPEVTTLHSQVGATVDYIFYSPRRISTTDQKAACSVTRDGLKLIGSLSLLSEEVLWSLKGLPNDVFPSDHLSLLAKFQVDLNAA